MGAVAGDHMSPISDTTVISSLACDVTLMQHVTTQAPYVFWVVFFAIVFGYIPIGYSAYPNFVGMLLGFLVRFTRVLLLCTNHFTHWTMGSNHHALLRPQRRTSTAIIRLCQEGQR